MNSYETILIAAALDDRDEFAVQYAARFACATGAKHIYLAHVAHDLALPEHVAESHPELVATQLDEAESRLQAVAAAHSGLFPKDAQMHCIARRGPLVAEFVRLAAEKSADLVCLARRASDDDPLSDAAGRLVRKTPCSVFVVP